MVDVTLRDYLPSRKDTLRQRRRERTAREQLASAARRYAALGWPVCQGAHPWPAARGRGRACSCDRIGCPAPGAHPVSPAWQMQASADAGAVGRSWAAAPEANVILVTGRVFDVLDAPAPAGMAALRQMEAASVAAGPVAAGPAGRTLFFVATRGAHGAQDEWWSCQLDCVPDDMPQAAGLRWHCRNSYVLAPPSRDGAGQAARWLREPEGRPLPDAVRLLEYLADAGDGQAR
jgi:bifunctional DNA primase/polymerase-like protein